MATLRILLALGAACALFATASSHASVIMPPSRNAVDSEPGTPWSGDHHSNRPETGWMMPYGSACTNGTSECRSGQAAFWFSQGCGIGCKACNGNGSRIPNADNCPELPKPPANETLDPQYRTTNQHTVPGSREDFYKFNPWRAPGNSPVYDPCGMAGGSPIHRFNAGEYNTTKFAKQGDLGSKVLKPRPSGTVWKRGSVARVRFQMSANHGGGYQYRYCPAAEPLTEACFQAHPLAFADEKHTIRYANASRDVEIPATVVKTGGGKGWMMWPFPNFAGGQCDYVVKPGKHCDAGCPGCGAPTYGADKACPCSCDGGCNASSVNPEWYKGLPAGNADPKLFPDPLPGGTGDYPDQHQEEFAIEDTLQVPADMPTGAYVLGWRWDAEMTSQIWQSCSDITIA